MISELAGVSPSTVSRSLNENPMIPEVTRKRIQQIASSLNFQFNSNAKSLKKGITYTIAIMYPSLFDDFKYSTYVELLLHEIKVELELLGYDSLIVNLINRKTGESNIHRFLMNNKVDGFIFLQIKPDKEELDLLINNEYPFVQVHWYDETSVNDKIDFYSTNNILGSRLATNYFIEQGINDICCITLSYKRREIQERIEGFCSTMKDNNLPFGSFNIWECDCTAQDAYQLIYRQKNELQQFRAFFIHADVMAIGVVNAIKDLGYSIPSDFQVIGYDDASLFDYSFPRLSTIHQPREDIARMACRRIDRIVKQGKQSVEHIKLAPCLILRETT